MLFLDGVVWQVGERGSIYTSHDLDLWLPQDSGTAKSLRSITAFKNQVIIAGEEGTIVSGFTPRDLIVRSLGTTNWLEGISASTNAVVAVGDNGTIYSTADGVSWNRRGNFTTWLRSVAYGGNQFITVGEDGFIATSPDGDQWQERSSGTSAHLNSVVWLNDRFWIVGDAGTVLTNGPGAGFARVPTGVTNTLFTVSANSNKVVIAGEEIVLMGSVDGGNWVQQSDSGSPLLAPNWPYYSSLWDGRLFLLSGQTGILVEGFRTNSTAPLHWYSNIQPTRSWLWSVARPADFYIAVGSNGAIVTSDDGVEWFREASPPSAEDQVLLGVGGNSEVILAAGSDGTILRSINVLTNIISTNQLGQSLTNIVNLLGVHWERVSQSITNDLQGVVVTDEMAILTGGNGTILTSSGPAPGTSWTPQSSGVTTFLSGVTAWPNGFVAVGADGVILSSENGLEWTPRNSGVELWIYAVRYVGGRLVAVGEDGLILTSSDGVDWQSRNSGTTEWINDVTFSNGTWYATAGDGIVVTSTDGITWNAERSITSKSLYGAATDGQQVIAVGLEGVIVRHNQNVATSPVNFESYANEGLTSMFLFTGQVDQKFIIEASESIIGPWRPAAYLEITDPAGILIYEIPNNNFPTRFFRTRLQ